MAEWMIACVLTAVWLSLAATAGEWVLLTGRAQVRAVWILALGLSVMIPAAAFWRAPRFPQSGVDVGPSTVMPLAPVANAVLLPAIVTRARATLRGRILRTLRSDDASRLLATANRPLAFAWIASAALLTLYIMSGITLLRRMRRRWRPTRVLGYQVLVSEATGPALVGLRSPAIVIPGWALAMEEPQLALMLSHEDEHRRAHDGQLLMIAQLLVIVMPWNPALWWQLARLRAGVELDCDARVLGRRHANARSYGTLLLEVARAGHAARIVGAPALTERAAQLERRIRLFIRPRGHMPRWRSIAAAALGGAAVLAACLVPPPAVPERVTAIADGTSPSTRGACQVHDQRMINGLSIAAAIAASAGCRPAPRADCPPFTHDSLALYPFQVDTPAVFVPTPGVSPRPVPRATGEITKVEFTIDTSGTIVAGSFHVLATADSALTADAARVAPTWRFTAASIRGCPVRELLQSSVAR